MKESKLLLSTIFVAALAGCANDDFVSSQSSGSDGDLNGKLVDAGLIGMSAGTDYTATTRAYSPSGNFVWMPEELSSTGEILNSSNQRVGLCWTGRNIDNPEYGAASAVTANVYSNYEFEHVDWLDVNATVPSTVECSTSEIDNGAFIVGQGTPVADFNGTTLTGGRYNAYYKSDDSDGAKGSYTSTSHEESTGVLNLGKGLFKTLNKSVYEGEYLTYYPYNDAFTRGPIIAQQPTSFDVDITVDKYATASKYAFSIGYLGQYDGGTQTTGLNARTLSGFALINLYGSGYKIKKVILYSQSKSLIYESGIDASKCIDALESLDSNGNIAEGASLMIAGGDGEQKTNVIYANLSDDSGTDYATIPTTGAQIAIPVLPQTVDDLQLIITNDNDESCTIPLESEAKTFKSNTATNITVDLSDWTFENHYVVVDEETLYSALTKIKDSGSETEINEIQLLNDITLNSEKSMSAVYNSTIFFNKDIKIYSEYDETKLILESGKKLSIKSLNDDATLDIDVDVQVKGRDCCGTDVARMSVGGTQDYVCNVNFNGTVTNEGTLVLGNNAEKDCNITVTTLVNDYDEYATTDEKKADAAMLYLVGGQNNGTSTIKIGELQNSGVVRSIATSVEIYQDNVRVNTPYNDGTSRVVATTIGTLANEGKLYLDMRVLMDVTASFTNSTEESLVDIEGESYSAYDGCLDVTASTASNEGTIDTRGVINFTKANLNNTGLFIDQTSGEVGGKYIDNNSGDGATKIHAGTGAEYTTDLPVEGIYVSQVHTAQRFEFVLTDAVVEPSTVIVEVLQNGTTSLPAGGQGYSLESIDPSGKLAEKDVYVKTESNCRFSATTENEKASSIGHCVTVFKDARLALNTGNFTAGNMNVNADAKVAVANGSLAVTDDMELYGTFNSLATSTYDINNVNVYTDATFDSNGTPNVIENFTLDGGTATFAYNTTTTINGKFTSIDGIFEREGLDGTSQYRATVNANEVDIQGGRTNTAWPTEIN